MHWSRIQSPALKKFADSQKERTSPDDEVLHHLLLRLQWEEVPKSIERVCVQYDETSNNIFFCAYSGRRFNSFVQFWDGVFNVGFSFASGSYYLSPEDHRVQ